jgi:hypothetical protein
LAFAALSAAGASLAFGVVSGVLALNLASDVKRNCDASGHCRAQDAAKAERATDWGTISTLSFIAAGGFLTIGTTILVLTPKTQDTGASLAVTGSF